MLPQLITAPSPRHRTGVFARVPIAEHVLVIEYAGELITPAEAERRYPEGDRLDPEHTFVLEFDETRVIDANVRGNAARFINHSCAPNVEPIAIGERMWLVSLRAIAVGEELGYDYAIELDERHTSSLKKRYPCSCAEARCRGTLLRSKRAPVAADVARARRAISARIDAVLAESE